MTGVHNKSLYLASYTPEDRLKWVSRITGYTQAQQMNRVKLKEHQRLKVTIATQVRAYREPRSDECAQVSSSHKTRLLIWGREEGGYSTISPKMNKRSISKSAAKHILTGY